MIIPHIIAIKVAIAFINSIIFCLSIIKESRLIVANVSKDILAGETFGFPSYLGTFSLTLQYLNTMIIQPKYNSPSSDVSTSNGSPLHSDGSHPVGGFLLGD